MLWIKIELSSIFISNHIIGLDLLCLRELHSWLHTRQRMRFLSLILNFSIINFIDWIAGFQIKEKQSSNNDVPSISITDFSFLHLLFVWRRRVGMAVIVVAFFNATSEKSRQRWKSIIIKSQCLEYCLMIMKQCVDWINKSRFINKAINTQMHSQHGQ